MTIQVDDWVQVKREHAHNIGDAEAFQANGPYEVESMGSVGSIRLVGKIGDFTIRYFEVVNQGTTQLMALQSGRPLNP